MVRSCCETIQKETAQFFYKLSLTFHVAINANLGSLLLPSCKRLQVMFVCSFG